MKTKPYLVFKIAKAIITNCETASQLHDVISFLKSTEDLDSVVKALEAFIDKEQFPKVKNDNYNEKVVKSEKISALITKLRKENYNVIEVEFLIAKEFHKQIPSNKVSLEKYIQKLSREAIFEQVCTYFMSENMHKPVIEDPWLKEMLNEQAKRDNAHR